MNTSITLRSLLGAAVVSAVVAGCGAEQGRPAERTPAGFGNPPSTYVSPCGPATDPIDRIIARKAGSDCQAERRNDEMHRLLGHT